MQARIAYVPGACWHRPEGPGSDTYTRARHPVTQVAHEGAFPLNGYGLLGMTGNEWEWTSDRFEHATETTCCGPVAKEGIERRVIKRGSHLCAPSYCLRYRPAARQGEAVDTSTSHIGFRCVLRQPWSSSDPGDAGCAAAGDLVTAVEPIFRCEARSR